MSKALFFINSNSDTNISGIYRLTWCSSSSSDMHVMRPSSYCFAIHLFILATPGCVFCTFSFPVSAK